MTIQHADGSRQDWARVIIASLARSHEQVRACFCGIRILGETLELATEMGDVFPELLQRCIDRWGIKYGSAIQKFFRDRFVDGVIDM